MSPIGAADPIPQAIESDLDLFLARNGLPHHHGAQAGHSAATRDASARFLAGFTPKLVFQLAGRSYAVFREGFPIHALAHYVATHQTYKERPDFVLVEGTVDVASAAGICTIKAELPHSTYLAQVREVNSSLPALVEWESQNDGLPSPSAILECSWNKTEKVAQRQLQRYTELMSPIQIEQTLFVSSGTGTVTTVPLLFIPRADQDAPALIGQLALFLEAALRLGSD